MRRGPEGRAARPAQGRPAHRRGRRAASDSGSVPRSIPDYLALVGDSADGFPGLPGWGAKSTATVLARYEHLDAIPDDAKRVGRSRCAARRSWRRRWPARVRRPTLFLDLATLRTDADVGAVDDWEWTGATPELVPLAARLGADNLVARCERLAKKRFG